MWSNGLERLNKTVQGGPEPNCPSAILTLEDDNFQRNIITQRVTIALTLDERIARFKMINAEMHCNALTGVCANLAGLMIIDQKTLRIPECELHKIHEEECTLYIPNAVVLRIRLECPHSAIEIYPVAKTFELPQCLRSNYSRSQGRRTTTGHVILGIENWNKNPEWTFSSEYKDPEKPGGVPAFKFLMSRSVVQLTQAVLEIESQLNIMRTLMSKEGNCPNFAQYTDGMFLTYPKTGFKVGKALTTIKGVRGYSH